MKGMPCAAVDRFVDTYLDGEFAENDRGELEAHLKICESCHAKVKQQAAWKFAIKSAAPREQAPAALRNSVMRKVAKESASVETRRWVTRTIPAAAAMGIALTLTFSPILQNFNLSPAVTAEVVAKHQRHLPLEISGGSDQVKKWYADKVDFPVRPPSFDRMRSVQMVSESLQSSPSRAANVVLRGGRLTNVRDRQAAYLQYEVDGDRVSVFMFDPSQLPLDAHHKKVVANRDVYFDQENGYNVALYEDHGVGYAIASDLDQDRMVSLVSAAVSP